VELSKLSSASLLEDEDANVAVFVTMVGIFEFESLDLQMDWKQGMVFLSAVVVREEVDAVGRDRNAQATGRVARIIGGK
jgi:hypothetical protein